MRKILLSILAISLLMTTMVFAKFGGNDQKFGGKLNFGNCHFGNCTTSGGGAPTTPNGQMQFLGDDMAFNGDAMVYNP